MDPIPDLLARWQQGDPQAAEQLFTHYSVRLTRLAEQHLSRAVQQREDGADVVQSVFRTFFRRSQAGEFRIDAAGDLWRLLAHITLLKARARGRHHTAQQRDVRAEAGDAPGVALLAREPDPADAAALVDLIDVLLQGRPPVFTEVLHRRLQGENITDIARSLRLSRKSIHVIIRQLKDRLQSLQMSASE